MSRPQKKKAYLGWARRLSKPTHWIIVCSGATESECWEKLRVIQADVDSGHHAKISSGVVLAESEGPPMPGFPTEEVTEALSPAVRGFDEDDETSICHKCNGTGLRKAKECRNCKGWGRTYWRNGNST